MAVDRAAADPARRIGLDRSRVLGRRLAGVRLHRRAALTSSAPTTSGTAATPWPTCTTTRWSATPCRPTPTSRSATGGSSSRRRSWWWRATDGCFGYLQTPMHFEHLRARRPCPERAAPRRGRGPCRPTIAAVTGDDAAMAVMGVGADLARLPVDLFAPRLAELRGEFIDPLDRAQPGRAGGGARTRRRPAATPRRDGRALGSVPAGLRAPPPAGADDRTTSRSTSAARAAAGGRQDPGRRRG